MEVTFNIDTGLYSKFDDGNKYIKHFIIVGGHRYMEIEEGWAVFNDSGCDPLKSFPACFCDIKWNKVFEDQKNEDELYKIKLRYLRRLKLNEIESR